MSEIPTKSREANTRPEDKTYFDIYLQENIDALVEKMDGPDGFFRKAEAAGVIKELDPKIGEMIDQIDDEALEILDVSKDELKIIAASFKGGQGRSLIKSIKIPRNMEVSQGLIRTEAGVLKVRPRPDNGKPAIPKGTFRKSAGELWILPKRLEEKYPHPAQRRIDAIWTFTHEFAHGVMDGLVKDMLAAEPHKDIELDDGTLIDPINYLRQMVSTSFPQEGITDYTRLFRNPDGSLPSDTTHAQQAIEEEICETVAATICGFAPIPGRPVEETIAYPFAGREHFQNQASELLQAKAA